MILLFLRSTDKKNLGSRELENYMRQVVDFKNEESICIFIKIFRAQLFEQVGALNINMNLKRSSFYGFLIISNILKAQEIVKNSFLFLIYNFFNNIFFSFL